MDETKNETVNNESSQQSQTDPGKPKKRKFGFLQDLFKKKPLGAVGMIILIILVLVAIFADLIAPYPMINGSMQIDVLHSLEKPYIFMNAEEKAEVTDIHILGTDSLGRDVLSYLIYGCRTSVILCLACAVISQFISVVIGTLSAVIGGWFDLIVQRIVDAWLSIPSMLILLILMSMLGQGMPQMIFAMSVPNGIGGSRIIRSAAISVKDSGYVKSANQLGAGTIWKTIRHIIPNILPLIITNMAGGLGGVVLMEASLSFLGYGVDPATPSWGYMITQQGKANMYTNPFLSVWPGLCITLMVFAANMFGDAVRDLLDPRLKGGVGSYSTKKLDKMTEKMKSKMEKVSKELI